MLVLGTKFLSGAVHIDCFSNRLGPDFLLSPPFLTYTPNRDLLTKKMGNPPKSKSFIVDKI